MKLFREALIIIGIYLLGELISKGLSLPIPGNILGLLILLALLCSNTLKLDKIETISSFFLNHLAFFFIPAGVGLITTLGVISNSFIQIIIICILTTIIVIAATGLIVQAIIKFQNKTMKGRN